MPAIKPHIHSFFQIIWFKTGNGKHYVDFKTYDVLDNAMFFIAPNEVHYFDDQEHYEGVLLHFNHLFLIQDESPLDFMLNCSLFNNPFQQPSCCIGAGIDTLLDQYVLQMKGELESEELFGKEIILRNYLKSFLIQVQRRKKHFEKVSEPQYLMRREWYL